MHTVTEIYIEDALIVGSNNWRKHSNLRVVFKRLTDYEYGTVRRHLNVPSFLSQNKELISRANEQGWNAVADDESVHREVYQAVNAIRRACRYLKVNYLVLSTTRTKLGYDKLVLDELVQASGAEVEYQLTDARSRTTTYVYRICH